MQANPSETLVLKDVDTYLLLLQQSNAASIWNYSSTAFVSQDFDKEVGKLKVSIKHYV